MDHYAEHQQPSMASHFLWGDYTSPGHALRSTAIRSAMVSPALGVGLFTLPGMIVQGALRKSGMTGLARLASPLFSGFTDFDGPLKGGSSLGSAAKAYWKKHGADEFAKHVPKNMFVRKGAGFDKYVEWLTGGKDVLKNNRRIMAMMGREMKLAGGLFSKAGWKAGSVIAGGGLGGAARIGMYGLSRALGPIGWALFAYDVGRAGYHAYKAIGNAANVAYSKQFQETAPPLVNNFEAQTQRRQALMAIQQSRMNARSVFGQEARRFHSL